MFSEQRCSAFAKGFGPQRSLNLHNYPYTALGNHLHTFNYRRCRFCVTCTFVVSTVQLGIANVAFTSTPFFSLHGSRRLGSRSARVLGCAACLGGGVQQHPCVSRAETCCFMVYACYSILLATKYTQSGIVILQLQFRPSQVIYISNTHTILFSSCVRPDPSRA